MTLKHNLKVMVVPERCEIDCFLLETQIILNSVATLKSIWDSAILHVFILLKCTILLNTFQEHFNFIVYLNFF